MCNDSDLSPTVRTEKRIWHLEAYGDLYPERSQGNVGIGGKLQHGRDKRFQAHGVYFLEHFCSKDNEKGRTTP